MSIDKALIEKRIQNFLGYGNLNSKHWFVFLEEGTNGNLDELEIRFRETSNKKILDCFSDMIKVKEHIIYYRGSKPKLQSTIAKAIRVHLNIVQNDTIDKETIREYQKSKFGRHDSDHCSLEFMPLPAPGLDKWVYGSLDIDFLKTRQLYNKYIMPLRTGIFNKAFEQYKPASVIFYGFKYIENWKEAAGVDFIKINDLIWSGANKLTKFFILPHPQMHGLTNDDWDNFGKLIKKKLKP